VSHASRRHQLGLTGLDPYPNRFITRLIQGVTLPCTSTAPIGADSARFAGLLRK
jgi:hypothetical protein